MDTVVLTADADRALALIRSAGATAVRIPVFWNAVAPVRPVHASKPGDSRYRWDDVDRSARLARQRSLLPILSLSEGAQVGGGIWLGAGGNHPARSRRVRPFRQGAAARYSGTFAGLPRVRYWQAWNEPNINVFLSPQYEGGRPFSPGWYRRMVNEFAAGVKAAHAGNLVVAAGTSPSGIPLPRCKASILVGGPSRSCASCSVINRSLKPKCKQRVRFDIWAHHPYTSGGPTHKVALPDDVSLGDLPEMSRVLRAGVKVGNIVSPRPVEFWVTEFSWDTDPPTRQRCRSTSRPAGSPKCSIGCGARNQSRDLVLDS